jgi:methenyltetrahydrofolate cyclohydrolase
VRNRAYFKQASTVRIGGANTKERNVWRRRRATGATVLQLPSWEVHGTGRGMGTNLQGLSDISVRDFIAAVGSAEEPHGIVSTAAVVGSLGSSLLLMVAALPRSNAVADRTKLIEAATALTGVQQQLIETIETETAVKLFTARNMPQANDAERSERQAAIQLALRASAEVPLEVMRLCARGLELAATVAAHSARAATAEVQLGVALLEAGFCGTRAHLEGKLSSFTDAAFVTSVVDEVGRLSEQTAGATCAAESSLKVLPA